MPLRKDLCACGFGTGRIIRPSSFSKDGKERHNKAGTLTKRAPEQNASGYVSMSAAIGRRLQRRLLRIAKGPSDPPLFTTSARGIAKSDGCVLNVLDAM